MEPVTWEWIAKEQAKSLREWESLIERMQPHIDSLKKYFELPERRILYQVDDAIRNDILDAVNRSPDERLSTITVQLGANWTHPNPGTPWLNPWPARKFVIEGLCSLPAWQALQNAGHEKEGRKFAQRFQRWFRDEISDMIENMWVDWIEKMIPKDIRSIKVEHEQRNFDGRGLVRDLVYSVHVEFSRPPAVPSLYQPLAPHEG
jgi:hypothetical protein